MTTSVDVISALALPSLLRGSSAIASPRLMRKYTGPYNDRGRHSQRADIHALWLPTTGYEEAQPPLRHMYRTRLGHQSLAGPTIAVYYNNQAVQRARSA